MYTIYNPDLSAANQFRVDNFMKLDNDYYEYERRNVYNRKPKSTVNDYRLFIELADQELKQMSNDCNMSDTFSMDSGFMSPRSLSPAISYTNLIDDSRDYIHQEYQRTDDFIIKNDSISLLTNAIIPTYLSASSVKSSKNSLIDNDSSFMFSFLTTLTSNFLNQMEYFTYMNWSKKSFDRFKRTMIKFMSIKKIKKSLNQLEQLDNISIISNFDEPTYDKTTLFKSDKPVNKSIFNEIKSIFSSSSSSLSTTSTSNKPVNFSHFFLRIYDVNFF